MTGVIMISSLEVVMLSSTMMSFRSHEAAPIITSLREKGEFCDWPTPRLKKLMIFYYFCLENRERAKGCCCARRALVKLDDRKQF